MDAQHGGQSSLFKNALGAYRLGTGHATLLSFHQAVQQTGKTDAGETNHSPTQFSLVVLLAQNSSQLQQENYSSISILLGKKLRGFGKGFYNCFGGKLENSLDEYRHPARGAVREIREETGIEIPLEVMEDGFVGTLNFTFEDWEVNKAMKVYLYCVVLSMCTRRGNKDNTLNPDGSTKVVINRDKIRGCDEIDPVWFSNVYDIPLHEMFADDSIWLTMLLDHYNEIFKTNSSERSNQNSGRRKIMFDAWFHFKSGGDDTNHLLHYYIENNSDEMVCTAIPPKPHEIKRTLEKQLFHALHSNNIQNPSIKEFKENWAMANAVRRHIVDEEKLQYVIDVAGGHGVLAALFLILSKQCHTATVIDPAIVKGKDGILRAWSPFWNSYKTNGIKSITKELKYRHECLRTGLRDELDTILYGKRNDGVAISPTNVLVVACHACQHLTDETMQIASEYGVNVACMPCCQKDHDGWWKKSAKDLGVSIGVMMDILSAGKMMAWETGSKAGIKYQVKMKLIDEKISPLQNRIILCKALDRTDTNEDDKTQLAHEKLTKAYHRAHGRDIADDNKSEQPEDRAIRSNSVDQHELPSNNSVSLLTGFFIGIAFSLVLTSSKLRKS